MAAEKTVNAVPNAPDFYAVLGVQRTANLDEIERAFRTLSPQFQGRKTEFRLLEEAHRVLADADLRRLYDTMGLEAARLAAKAKAGKEAIDRAKSRHSAVKVFTKKLGINSLVKKVWHKVQTTDEEDGETAGPSQHDEEDTESNK